MLLNILNAQDSPTTENDLPPKVSCAQVERPCTKMSFPLPDLVPNNSVIHPLDIGTTCYFPDLE